MANYNDLKTAIQQVIRTNGNEEITGAIMQQSLLSMINSLGAGYQFMGVATPSTNPGTPDQKVFYIAASDGVYVNFNNIAIKSGEISVLRYDTSWQKSEIVLPKTIYTNPQKIAYENSIAELYLDASKLTDVVKVDCRNYGGTMYVLGGNSSNTVVWRCVQSVANVQNGQVFVIKCTTAGGSVSVNDIIGYVVFKDIDTFRTTDSGSEFLNLLNLSYVTHLYYFPQIASSLYGSIEITQEILSDYTQRTTITKENVNYNIISECADRRFYSYPTDVTVVPIYETCIKELYITPKAINGTSRITFQNYAGTLYVYAYNSSGETWRATKDLANYNNGDVIPIVCTTAGGGVSVGDVVGYVIFKDITTFKATDYGGSLANLNYQFVSKLFLQPQLMGGLATSIKQEITQDNFIKTTINCVGEEYYIYTDSIDHRFYSYPSLASPVPTYETCIKELYFYSKYLGTLTGVSFSNYGGTIYCYGKTDNVETWRATKGLANYNNGDVIPIVCTVSGGGVSVGDVVGYVIFKDIETFKATNYGSSSALVNLPFVTKLFLQPLIWDATGVSTDVIDQRIAAQVPSQVAIALANNLKIAIPNTVYAIVGTELNIWNDTVSLSIDKGLQSPLNYSIDWYCLKGLVTERGFRFTPTVNDIGEVVCTCTLYNIIGQVIATKQFTIKVVAQNAISVAKRIVYFGDSLGEQSALRLYQNFQDSTRYTGIIPTMLGTKGIAPKYEAVGGYSWKDFATSGRRAFRCYVSGVGAISLNSQYTNNNLTWTVVEVNVTGGVGNILITRNETMSSTNAPETNGTLIPVGAGDSIPYTNATLMGANPLWNNDTGQLDIARYRSLLGLGNNDKIDAVSFQLGLNASGTEIDIIRGYITSLYNAFIADNPNCIFILGLVTSSGNTANGFGANYGATSRIHSELESYYNERVLYLSFENNASFPNLRIATPNLNLDRYYGYGFGLRKISDRFNGETITSGAESVEISAYELYHNNAAHPKNSGYNQIADAFLAAFVSVLSE